jgi:phosphatidylserine/phosphatidylglycerophosphate/cardiolipin synthase-like enzyme
MASFSWFRPLLALALACGLLLTFYDAGQPAQATPAAPLYLPYLAGPRPGALLIAAAHVDSARSGEADEAILLWNTTSRPVDLAGWQLAANGRTARFPATVSQVIDPGGWLWCTAQAHAFRTTFGDAPGCEWNAADTVVDDPAVPNLEGSVLQLTNTGGVISLLDPAGHGVDTLLYGGASTPATGWSGPPAQLYTRGAIAAAGQLYHRKTLADGLPLDRDHAADWGGDLADLAWGRRVRLPGWLGYPDAAAGRPIHGDATATLTLAVAPEGLYPTIAAALDGATATLDLSVYAFEHPALAQHVAQAAARGVRVRLLLEGAPPGGVTNLERWCVRQITAAGGDVRFLAAQDGAPRGLQPRYRYTHAKFGVVDGRLALVGTENFSWESMPVTATQPVGGRRGYYLLTDATPVVRALARLFAADWAPDRFLDLQPYTPGHAKYGDPPADYTPPPPPVFLAASAPFTLPLTVTGPAQVVVVSAPENAVLPDDGLHAILARAGRGDHLYLEQLYEHKYWGPGDGNPTSDPNPRLEAVIDAARRGAQVRVLLDSFFDDGEDLRSNRATVDYVRSIAAAEGLDLDARVGNPTGGGVHAKLVLAQVDGETWSAVGSLNGGEISHKLNREVMVLTDQPDIYARLAEVFSWDWALCR